MKTGRPHRQNPQLRALPLGSMAQATAWAITPRMSGGVDKVREAEDGSFRWTRRGSAARTGRLLDETLQAREGPRPQARRRLPFAGASGRSRLIGTPFFSSTPAPYPAGFGPHRDERRCGDRDGADGRDPAARPEPWVRSRDRDRLIDMQKPMRGAAMATWRLDIGRAGTMGRSPRCWIPAAPPAAHRYLPNGGPD